MWLFLPFGFLSAVVNRDDPTTILVRARDPKALAHLVKWLEVNGYAHDPTFTLSWADYPFRVVIPRHAFANFLAAQALELDVANFKQGAELLAPPDSPYVPALHQVWAVLNRAFAHLRP